MNGRYGNDHLNHFLTIVTFILIILSFIFKFVYLDIAAVALLAISYFRMFSRNTEQRWAENEKFLEIVDRLNPKSHGKTKRDPNYRYFSCPHCRQKVRVPKGRGKICVTCPKCRTEFIRKS